MMSNKCIVFLTFDPVEDIFAVCPEVDEATMECESIRDKGQIDDIFTAVNTAISSSLGSVNCATP